MSKNLFSDAGCDLHSNLVSLHRVSSISFHKCLQQSACKERIEKLAEVKMYTIYEPTKLPHIIMVVATN